MVDVNFRRSKCADNVDQGNRERENEKGRESVGSV